MEDMLQKITVASSDKLNIVGVMTKAGFCLVQSSHKDFFKNRVDSWRVYVYERYDKSDQYYRFYLKNPASSRISVNINNIEFALIV